MLKMASLKNRDEEEGGNKMITWNCQSSTVLSSIQRIYKTNKITDVTLFTSDGELIPAHQLMLSACSEVLEGYFTAVSKTMTNNISVMVPYHSRYVRQVLSFVYEGQVQLADEDIPGFLGAAQALHIKGVCSDDFKDQAPVNLARDDLNRIRFNMAATDIFKQTLHAAAAAAAVVAKTSLPSTSAAGNYNFCDVTNQLLSNSVVSNNAAPCRSVVTGNRRKRAAAQCDGVSHSLDTPRKAHAFDGSASAGSSRASSPNNSQPVQSTQNDKHADPEANCSPDSEENEKIDSLSSPYNGNVSTVSEVYSAVPIVKLEMQEEPADEEEHNGTCDAPTDDTNSALFKSEPLNHEAVKDPLTDDSSEDGRPSSSTQPDGTAAVASSSGMMVEESATVQLRPPSACSITSPVSCSDSCLTTDVVFVPSKPFLSITDSNNFCSSSALCDSISVTFSRAPLTCILSNTFSCQQSLSSARVEDSASSLKSDLCKGSPTVPSSDTNKPLFTLQSNADSLSMTDSNSAVHELKCEYPIKSSSPSISSSTHNNVSDTTFDSNENMEISVESNNVINEEASISMEVSVNRKETVLESVKASTLSKSFIAMHNSTILARPKPAMAFISQLSSISTSAVRGSSDDVAYPLSSHCSSFAGNSALGTKPDRISVDCSHVKKISVHGDGIVASGCGGNFTNKLTQSECSHADGNPSIAFNQGRHLKEQDEKVIEISVSSPCSTSKSGLFEEAVNRRGRDEKDNDLEQFLMDCSTEQVTKELNEDRMSSSKDTGMSSRSSNINSDDQDESAEDEDHASSDAFLKDEMSGHQEWNFSENNENEESSETETFTFVDEGLGLLGFNTSVTISRTKEQPSLRKAGEPDIDRSNKGKEMHDDITDEERVFDFESKLDKAELENEKMEDSDDDIIEEYSNVRKGESTIELQNLGFGNFEIPTSNTGFGFSRDNFANFYPNLPSSSNQGTFDPPHPRPSTGILQKSGAKLLGTRAIRPPSCITRPTPPQPAFPFPGQQADFSRKPLLAGSSSSSSSEMQESLKIASRHGLSTLVGQNKSFACPLCKKTFEWASLLNTHMRIHTGEKPFRCPLCPYRSTQKGNVQRHIYSKHPNSVLNTGGGARPPQREEAGPSRGGL